MDCCSRGSISTSRSSAPEPYKVYACLYRPPVIDHDDRRQSSSSGRGTVLRPCPTEDVVNTLVAVAREFSPRYERHRDNLVSIDVSGLDRLIGPPATIGEELRREVVARGVRVH